MISKTAELNKLSIDLLSIFPKFFDSFLASSLVAKAVERSLLSVNVRDIRASAEPPHFSVDDSPYGGGAGMVMRPDVLVRSIEASRLHFPETHVVLLSASGTPFTQSKALELSAKPALTLVCGRYEGVDQRAIDLAVDEEISIGDYVVMGGEVPAMVLIEAVLRLRPEVLGNEASSMNESYQSDAAHGQLLEGPQFTRPPIFRDLAVPETLLSGNHKQIEDWRKTKALERTLARRPDLARALQKSKREA